MYASRSIPRTGSHPSRIRTSVRSAEQLLSPPKTDVSLPRQRLGGQHVHSPADRIVKPGSEVVAEAADAVCTRPAGAKDAGCRRGQDLGAETVLDKGERGSGR